MTPARILGIASARPARSLSNDDLVAAGVDTTDDWVRTRTGIASRGVAAADESLIDLATAAGDKALAAAGVAAADIDLVLLATCTMPTSLPGGAAQVAHRLGAVAGAADVNAACAGFCYGLSMAADAVRAGSARHVLVVAAERLTGWLDWNDRATCVLFGDGAGAAVVGPAADGVDGIAPPVWGSDGAGASFIRVDPGDPHIRMEGAAVFRWAATTLAPFAAAACTRAGVALEDLAAFVPHQANARIIDAIAKPLVAAGMTNAVISRDVETSGNTSAASVPLALSRLLETGAIRSGDPVLLFAFGAGLTYAGQVVRCP